MASLPYLPKIGSHCTVRGEKGKWRVVNHVNEELVKRCVMQSLESGRVVRKFNFEVSELPSSTYAEINKFLREVSEIEPEELDFIFEEPFDLKNVLDATTTTTDTESPPHDMKGAVDDTKSTDPQNPPVAKRFKSASANDVNKLCNENTERNTDKQTKWAVKVFKEWMMEVGLDSADFEALEVAELDGHLQRSYASVRTKEGTEFSKLTLVALRAGLNRHLTAPPFSRILNLMNDRDFMVSNQVLTGLIKSLKREGKDVSRHKEPICKEDLTKLYESSVFSTESPKTLQNKVIFEIICQFGRRGQEGLRDLKKDSFKLNVDAKGRKYVHMAYNEADKTHHGIDNRETQKEPRMYENKGKYCPVRSFEKYISKLNPGIPQLFQRPLTKVTVDTPTWYARTPVGVNTLSSFMSTLSTETNVSQRYTNHCIRAHITSTLHEQGFSNRSIMSVSGHRCYDSLTYYIKPTEDERERVSKALCPMAENSDKVECNTNSTVQSGIYSPPTAITSTSSSTGSSNVDVRLQENRALNMFTGNLSDCNITMNVYTNK